MRPLFCCLLGLLFLAAPFAHASNQDAVAHYKQLLEQPLSDENTAANKQQRELYQKILNAYQDAIQFDEKTQRLREQVERQPNEIATLEQRLAQPSDAVPAVASNQSINTLEQQLTLQRARLLELEQSYKQLQKQTQDNDPKLVSLREMLAQQKQALTQLEMEPASELKDALYARLTAHIQALEFELLSLPGLNTLNRLRMEIQGRELAQQTALIEQTQDLLQAKRRLETEATLLALTPEQSQPEDPALQAQQQINNRDSQLLRERLAEIDTQRQRRRLQEAELDLITQSYAAVQQQLELSAQPLGVELRKFTRTLAKPIDTDQTRAAINQARLSNLDIARQLYAVSETTTDPQPTAIAQQLGQLRTDHHNLLIRIREANNHLIDELSQLLAVQEQINKQVRLGRQLISQHLLWIPSILPISADWPQEIYNGFPLLVALFEPIHPEKLWLPSQQWLPLVALWCILSALCVMTYQRYRHMARDWGAKIGNVVHDRFSHTFSMFWLPLFITLPIPAGLYLFSRFMLNQGAWEHESYYLIANTPIFFGWIYSALLLWLQPNNALLHKHFGVPLRLCNTLRHWLHLLFWLGVPLVMLLIAIDQSDSNTLRSGPGRLLFILLALLVTLFWSALWKVAPQINQLTHSHRWWQKSQLWLTCLIGMHLLITLTALLGYVFSGSIAMLLLLVITCVFYTTFLFFKFGNRWLLIEERRLAFDRAKQRRNDIVEAREKNEDPPPPLEENYIDLQTISDQARIMLKAATVLVFMFMLWGVMKNVLPALDFLDKVVLWNSSSADGSVVAQTITLKNILFGLTLIVLCIVGAYNLPGLLELLVLRHLTLSPGTAYAITTITKYVLIVASIMAGAYQLGLEWAKLQWLIAALGVGLGFGLQEIVANFVSGLIILFEKPIRIGDTVTIGNYTGTVTRIQIRATTISDWDRKEVIIPNKNFVTDQLINWSLTDPITRVVIPVGVAYGSDTTLARQLMLQAVTEHPKVLQDPEPTAFFLAFGDSALNMDVRFFVSCMADRLVVTHEINERIDALFKAHDIVIAFPQLDIHLHKDQ